MTTVYLVENSNKFVVLERTIIFIENINLKQILHLTYNNKKCGYSIYLLKIWHPIRMTNSHNLINIKFIRILIQDYLYFF